ncbi:MAG: DUF92 domain-containing protein [Spirochaetaceae bacterium]
MSLTHAVVAVALNAVAAVGARRRDAVTTGGAVAGFLVGAGILAAGGWVAWILLMTFFGSSSVLSRFGTDAKKPLDAIHEKGERRDHVQVLANGGLGLLLSIAYAVTNLPGFLIGVAVSFAAANADTWASEIGVLSRRTPVSIITGRPIPRGTSGGVTLLGFAASAAGAAVIAAVFVAGRTFQLGWTPRATGVFALVFAGGVLGAVIDSILGATVQAQYRDRARGIATERSRSARAGVRGGAAAGEERNTLIRGWAAVTNDVVNAASSLLSTAVAALLYALAL